MIRRPPRSTPFPTRRSSDLFALKRKCGRDSFGCLDLLSEEWCAPPTQGGKGRVGDVRVHAPRAHHRHRPDRQDRKSTRLNSSHGYISYAVFCLKKKKTKYNT